MQLQGRCFSCQCHEIKIGDNNDSDIRLGHLLLMYVERIRCDETLAHAYMNRLNVLPKTRLSPKSSPTYIARERLSPTANKFHMAVPIVALNESLAAHIAFIIALSVPMDSPLVFVQVPTLSKCPSAQLTSERV